ncbi:MAG: TonB-dependent receptor [Saprospiraceae bacterium]|nr:TonB-dependent receptor [Saprospiraceae bacterium]
MPLDNTTDEYEEIKTSFAAAKVELGNNDWTLTPRVYWRKNADDYFFVRNQAVFNSTTSDVLGGELNFSTQSALGMTGLGVNIQDTKFKSSRLGDRKRTQWSIFGEHRFTFLAGKIDLTPGFMFTTYSDFGNGFFPGIDLGVKITEGLKGYASWGRTLRIPTYTDLYFSNGGNLPNPDLKPEFAQNFEAGLKYGKNGLRLSAAAFVREGSDIIDRTKTVATERWFPTNVSDLRLFGVEFSADVAPRLVLGLDDFFPIKKLNFGATYLPKIDYKTPSDRQLSRYAADQLRWQINFSTDFEVAKKFIPTLNVRYFERFTLPKGFDSAYKGFLTDVRLAWAEKNWRVFGQVNNLFNKKYTESNGITMPRRWFSVGLRRRFNLFIDVKRAQSLA